MTMEFNGLMDLMELDRVGMGMGLGDIVLTDLIPHESDLTPNT
jgi:hypothetical protein